MWARISDFGVLNVMQLSDDDKQTILARITSGSCTDSDQEIVRQLLLSADPAFLTEIIKYNVRIENGRDIHIGDNTTINFNEQAFVQVLEALQQSGWHSDTSIYQHLEVLETVNLNSELIEMLNQRLRLLEGLRDQSRLSENQKTDLQKIQRQVRTINQLNKDLKFVARQAKRLLQDVQSELIKNLQVLKSESRELIESQEVARLSNHLEAMNSFIQGLNVGKQASQWFAQSGSQFRETALKRSLTEFCDIRDRASSEQLSDLDFSIQQFFQQVTLALELGDYSILDAPEIPLTFDSPILYITVFKHVKEMLPRQHLPIEVTEQIEECLDYLVESLPRLY
jgi:Effector-associated domain 10